MSNVVDSSIYFTFSLSNPAREMERKRRRPTGNYYTPQKFHIKKPY